MYAKIDDFEVPEKCLVRVIPLIEGVRIIGEATGDKDCDVIADRLSRFKEGIAVNLNVISTDGEQIAGNYVVSDLKLNERRVLLNKRQASFHIVMKRQ